MKKALIYIVVTIAVVCGGGMLLLRGAMNKAPVADAAPVTVQRGDLGIQVVETGTLNANNTIELKSLVSGRLKSLFVDEGSRVKAGELIAIIDPRETQLQVNQLTAQMNGAESAAQRAQIEMEQRKISARSDLASAQARLAQAQVSAKAQPELTRTAIAQARTALASATSERDRIITSQEPGQRIEAENTVAESQANLANAQAEYNRDAALLGKGYVSEKQVEDSKLAIDLAQTRLKTAQDNLQTIVAGFSKEQTKAEEAIKQAQAALDSAIANSIQDKLKRQDYLSAVADRDKAVVALRDVAAMKKGIDQDWSTVRQFQATLADGQRNLGETEIKSPIDGIVTKKEIRQGELVTSISGFSSGSPIIRIEDRSSMKVALDINEIDVARMTVGMPVDVAVDALPDLKIKGKISKIAPSSTSMDTNANSGSTSSTTTATDTVVKYLVEVTIPHPTDALRSGMTAKCTFNLQHKSNVLYVPLEYVGHDDKGDFLMVQTGKPQKGKPAPTERRSIVTGIKNATNVEIKSGVKEGETLALPDYKGPKRQGAMGMGGG